MGAFRFADCYLHSLEFGEADRARGSVVFLHGRYGEASHWESVARGLRGAARCVCIDLPGFGHSYTVLRPGVTLLEAATLIEYVMGKLEREPSSPLVLVGHDIGGTIALMSAIRLADRLSGLVLINATCLTCPPAGLSQSWLARLRLRKNQVHAEAERLPTYELRRQVVDPWNIRAISRARLAALRLLKQTWPGHYERLAWKNALATVSCPALLLEGSGKASPEFAGELLRKLPEAELLEHACESHWLPLESPHWVSARIREFLYRLTASSARKSLSR
jgi:pimeloyl-ACP methyl ester carboxylesterase